MPRMMTLLKSELPRADKVRIAVTSFLIEESSWAKAAAGSPDLSQERYKRISRLSNYIIKCRPKPDYVVFPELAIPRHWAPTLAHHFLKEGISLITGVEYEKSTTTSYAVVNDARLYLTDNRLGYPSFVVQTQRKGVAAHHERDELRRRYGLKLEEQNPDACRKCVYKHNDFCFGLLICSELSDITHRQKYRGMIDNLFVLSWNKDLESFSSLLEASALDIHSYITLVNNREYGDSRVRAPYKEAWKRDLVRVKGGTDDYFVVTELDIPSLREYQSHNEPPDQLFKPFPEGFVIANNRKIIPGS